MAKKLDETIKQNELQDRKDLAIIERDINVKLASKEFYSNEIVRCVLNVDKERNACALKEQTREPKTIHANQLQKQENGSTIEFVFTIYEDPFHFTEKKISTLNPGPTRSTPCLKIVDDQETEDSKRRLYKIRSK